MFKYPGRLPAQFGGAGRLSSVEEEAAAVCSDPEGYS